jgi:hypothetical protein
MLEQKGINNAKGSKQQIKNMAECAGISLTYQKQDIHEDWEGKAKGTEQILRERGWINPSQDRKSYTVHGKKFNGSGREGQESSVPHVQPQGL